MNFINKCFFARKRNQVFIGLLLIVIVSFQYYYNIHTLDNERYYIFDKYANSYHYLKKEINIDTLNYYLSEMNEYIISNSLDVPQIDKASSETYEDKDTEIVLLLLKIDNAIAGRKVIWAFVCLFFTIALSISIYWGENYYKKNCSQH